MVVRSFVGSNPTRSFYINGIFTVYFFLPRKEEIDMENMETIDKIIHQLDNESIETDAAITAVQEMTHAQPDVNYDRYVAFDDILEDHNFYSNKRVLDFISYYLQRDALEVDDLRNMVKNTDNRSYHYFETYDYIFVDYYSGIDGYTHDNGIDDLIDAIKAFVNTLNDDNL